MSTSPGTINKLMEYYEQALLMRGNTPQELAARYRSLVGALLFPCPVTRVDCLLSLIHI